MNAFPDKTLESTEPHSDQTQEYFPIRQLAEKTHVGTSTLRAWERRYGLLTPARTPKGHRLYRHSDIQRVLKILDLLQDGHSLPNIAELLSTEDLSGRQANSSVPALPLSIINQS